MPLLWDLLLLPPLVHLLASPGVAVAASEDEGVEHETGNDSGEEYGHDDEWQDGQPPEPSRGAPFVLYATEYKTGTHLADDLATALLASLDGSVDQCAALHGGLREPCVAEPRLDDYRLRWTKTHSWVNLDLRPVRLLAKAPQHRAVFFFRDPVDILASAYLYSWNTSECAARSQLYTLVPEEGDCDYKTDTLKPHLWKTKADGILELAGEAFFEQLDTMDAVLRQTLRLPNARTVWMDELLPGHKGVNQNLVEEIYNFSLSRLRSSAHPARSPSMQLLRRAAAMANKKVQRSMLQDGAAGGHIHKSSDRKAVVAEIKELAKKHSNVAYFVKLQRRWQQFRKGAATRKAKTARTAPRGKRFQLAASEL